MPTDVTGSGLGASVALPGGVGHLVGFNCWLLSDLQPEVRQVHSLHCLNLNQKPPMPGFKVTAAAFQSAA